MDWSKLDEREIRKLIKTAKRLFVARVYKDVSYQDRDPLQKYAFALPRYTTRRARQKAMRMMDGAPLLKRMLLDNAFLEAVSEELSDRQLRSKMRGLLGAPLGAEFGRSDRG